MSHRVRALLSARRSCRAVSISACSPSTRSCSSCCCSMTRMLRSPQGSSLSLRINIAPITTGMPSCRVFSRARCTPGLVHGTFDPDQGLRFDADKVLVDPYGLVVPSPGCTTAGLRRGPGQTVAVAMKSVVADPDRYDWEGDRRLERPFAETVIYELHVGDFTRHRSSGVATEKRGTYAGLIEHLSYLKDLGRHRGGAASGFPVRLAGLPAGQDELLGLCTRFGVRATPGVQLAEERARDP